MTQDKFKSKLDEVLSSILIYEKSDLFIVGFKDEINTKNISIKKIKEYNLLFSDINYFFKKVTKYEIYFKEFYPISKKISDSEALEYHIYSYLQDITILRNKLVTFLNTLRKDLKKRASNKKEVEDFFVTFVDKIYEVFKDTVEKNRNPHHHHGFRFLVGDLIDSTMFSYMLSNDFSLKEKLNVGYVKKRKKESFEKAKNDYINIAKKNSKQIKDLLNFIFENTSGYIYSILGIESIYKFIKK